jgi:hypothetical protein
VREPRGDSLASGGSAVPDVHTDNRHGESAYFRQNCRLLAEDHSETRPSGSGEPNADRQGAVSRTQIVNGRGFWIDFFATRLRAKGYCKNGRRFDSSLGLPLPNGRVSELPLTASATLPNILPRRTGGTLSAAHALTNLSLPTIVPKKTIATICNLSRRTSMTEPGGSNHEFPW